MIWNVEWAWFDPGGLCNGGVDDFVGRSSGGIVWRSKSSIVVVFGAVFEVVVALVVATALVEVVLGSSVLVAVCSVLLSATDSVVEVAADKSDEDAGAAQLRRRTLRFAATPRSRSADA